jgi:hypothetical protein
MARGARPRIDEVVKTVVTRPPASRVVVPVRHAVHRVVGPQLSHTAYHPAAHPAAKHAPVHTTAPKPRPAASHPVIDVGDNILTAKHNAPGHPTNPALLNARLSPAAQAQLYGATPLSAPAALPSSAGPASTSGGVSSGGDSGGGAGASSDDGSGDTSSPSDAGADTGADLTPMGDDSALAALSPDGAGMPRWMMIAGVAVLALAGYWFFLRKPTRVSNPRHRARRARYRRPQDRRRR